MSEMSVWLMRSVSWFDKFAWDGVLLFIVFGILCILF